MHIQAVRKNKSWRVTYLALETLSSLFELVHFVLEVWGSFRKEHEDVGLDVSTKDFRGSLQKKKPSDLDTMDFSGFHWYMLTCAWLAGYLLSKLNDQWQLVGLDKGQKIFFGHLSIKVVASFVKLKKQGKIIWTHVISLWATYEFTEKTETLRKTNKKPR